MKAWMQRLADSADYRHVLLHKLGGCVARLFLFGSVFLLHPGERCAHEDDRTPASLADMPSGLATRPAAGASPASDNPPPTDGGHV